MSDQREKGSLPRWRVWEFGDSRGAASLVLARDEMQAAAKWAEQIYEVNGKAPARVWVGPAEDPVLIEVRYHAPTYEFLPQVVDIDEGKSDE